MCESGRQFYSLSDQIEASSCAIIVFFLKKLFFTFTLLFTKVEALPRIPKPEDLSNIIDKQRETGRSTFGLGGSLGLGFRYFIDLFVLSQKLSVFYINPG